MWWDLFPSRCSCCDVARAVLNWQGEWEGVLLPPCGIKGRTMSQTDPGDREIYLKDELTDSQYRYVLRLVNRGVLLRLWQGVFVHREYWSGLSDLDRQKKQAALISHYTGYPLLGRSAALLHGLPMPFNLAALPVELGNEYRESSGGVLYRYIGPLLPAHFITVGKEGRQYSLSDVTRTCIDVARWYPLTEAVTYMDHALRRKRTTPAQLENYIGAMKGFKGIKAARTAVKLATPWSESPRESFTKVAMFQAGLPAPLQQATILDINGDLLGRVDFLFEDISMAVEYDGAGKHEGQFGIDPLRAIRQEFDRHGLLTHEGLLVFRLNAASFTHRDGIPRLINQHRKLAAHPRPFPAHLIQAPGRAWR